MVHGRGGEKSFRGTAACRGSPVILESQGKLAILSFHAKM